MIRITSKSDGFRRAGIAHPAAPTDYQDDAFTKPQLAQLKAEPMLVVEVIADEPAGKKPAEKSEAKTGTNKAGAEPTAKKSAEKSGDNSATEKTGA